MPENPYEPPRTTVDDAAGSEHRGSPLTRAATPTSGSMRDAFVVSLLQQVPWSFINALVLDGGQLLRLVAIVLLVFWGASLWILIGRRDRITKYDVLFIKWGFVPLWFVGFMLYTLFITMYE